MAVSEKTYTKSDVIQVLSYMKTPAEIEIIANKRLGHGDDDLNNTDAFQFMLGGAEVMVDALLEGLSAEETRTRLIHSAAKITIENLCRSMKVNL